MPSEILRTTGVCVVGVRGGVPGTGKGIAMIKFRIILD